MSLYVPSLPKVLPTPVPCILGICNTISSVTQSVQPSAVGVEMIKIRVVSQFVMIVLISAITEANYILIVVVYVVLFVFPTRWDYCIPVSEIHFYFQEINIC